MNKQITIFTKELITNKAIADSLIKEFSEKKVNNMKKYKWKEIC